MNWRSLILVFAVTLAFAGKTTTTNISVTTYVSDLDTSGTAYYIQSDGEPGPTHGTSGEYDDGLQGVMSFLNANTYNHEPPGDWTLNLLSSTVRTMRLTLSSANAIPQGQPGYTVPPTPPFQGTDNLVSKFEEKCTAIFLDVGTMNKVGQTIICPAIFRFNWGSTYYRVYMTGSWGGTYPETTQVQIQCNGLGTNGLCSDWFLDPIPVVNADGTVSPGRAIGRLATPSHNSETNDGDYYITFHVHVTRP
jgi:hypothetical protein